MASPTSLKLSSETEVERTVDTESVVGSDESIGAWEATALEDRTPESDLLRSIRCRGRKLKDKLIGSSKKSKVAMKRKKESRRSSDWAVGEEEISNSDAERNRKPSDTPIAADRSVYYILEVVLKEGRDLVIRDSCGTSDPYVKFKVGRKLCYRSKTIKRNLNPRWDEAFCVQVDDPKSTVVRVKVYDYDRGKHDDRMGVGVIRTSELQPNQPTDLKLVLSDDRRKMQSPSESNFGYLLLRCTLVQEDKLQYIKRMTRSGSTASSASGSSGGGALIDSVKRAASAAVTSATGVATGVTSAAMTASSTGKVQQWNSVVTIVLIDGKNLVARDDDGFSDPYVKFRLGNERYKSKTKPKTLSPTWYEQFDLYMYDDQPTCLEISVFDRDQGARDDFMGRSKIDLADYPRDQTHHLELVLEDQAGTIRLLVTVSGTRVTAVDSHTQRVTTARERTEIVRKYGLFRSLKNLKDVGWMQVKVLKAQDLKSADIGGKSDPYCVLELVNDRLQTHTEYKTLFPEWGKVFTFNVKDIHSVLEVTVYDEDPNKKIEFLGKVAIPLLRVKRGQVQRYELRDQKLLTTVRGSIDLEIDLIFNDFKAAVRTFNPKEKKYMQPEPRFKIVALKNNVDRVYKIAEAVLRFGEFMQSCFSWHSTPRSISAFFVFLVIVWNFELYMLPLTLIIILLKNLIYLQFSGGASNCREEEHVNLREEDDDDDSKDSAKGQTLREKLQSIQDVCLVIQERMDMVASLFERIKNAFRWSVPWLSALAIIVLTIATVLLYHIPIRYIILVWGVNKFTKKLRSPNVIDNNEVLDYLSRVPSDKELIEYRELRAHQSTAASLKKR